MSRSISKPGGKFAMYSAAAVYSAAVFAVAATTLITASTAIVGVAVADDFGMPQVRLINERIAEGWAAAGVSPSAAATDAEWCRRVHLDLIGRIPTIKELDAYLTDSTRSKRLAIVDRLLGEEYADEYARHWTDVWTAILVGKDVANQMVSRPGMREYLRQAFVENRPYDRFVTELVTATGVNVPGAEGFNGATNFLTGKMAEDGIQAAAKTAQVFLGLQVQCTQCHNHPFNKGKQNQFWEFNAFFRQTRSLRRFEGGMQVQAVELVDEDFAGEAGRPEEAEIYYELRNGLKKVAYPVFVDGTAISRSGYLPARMADGTEYGTNRRRELGSLIVASPLMAKAIVNRTWGFFLGHAFTRPADDLGDHNQPSHPELLDELAIRFRDERFDMKSLAKWIVLSEPYALSSRTTKKNAADDPSLGEKPAFSHFYLRQMSAEQVYQSLLTATQADAAAGSEAAAKKKDAWLSQFVIAFGTDEGDEATTFNGSIPQVLMMFNGDLIRTATGVGKGGFLDSVARSAAPNAAKINTLYQAALARKPSALEVDVANAVLVARRGDAVGALQDVWWAVLNSNEFIMNH